MCLFSNQPTNRFRSNMETILSELIKFDEDAQVAEVILWTLIPAHNKTF